jgi:hypothetical protein
LIPRSRPRRTADADVCSCLCSLYLLPVMVAVQRVSVPVHPVGKDAGAAGGVAFSYPVVADAMLPHAVSQGVRAVDVKMDRTERRC